MNMKEKIEAKNRNDVLDKQALKRAVDATILKMKETYKDVREPRYNFCGWAWLVLKRSDNKQLLDLFKKYAADPPNRICSSRVLYHLKKSDILLAEETDDDASEQAISSGWCETSETEEWKKQHFEIRFDFKDNNGNNFGDQSMQYKEEVYEFLLNQLRPFGVNAEIETRAD